ncbi:MAG: 1-(5-phosphoribosyl)-5-[(5-phosphoribosylamino)methylideneamino]imidazole-4-carboxamide isomerase [Muribaculaceae bacterium]|nr:1-(5-phosphoribosyl)-5-[(5-phosphoribosylamino)methylideneamino]imidazole-4-carboxamide isomerase [Muribaculaceae bacterium]
MIDIVPAIDIIGGKCVRLSKGDYGTQKVYNESPLDVARAFEDAGCTLLHLVDLDGAKSKHIVNYRTLETIAGHTNLHIDFGGGLKSDDDLRIAFESGAEKVTGGSIAVTDHNMFEGWLKKYGSDAIILGADARGGKISTNGWLDDSDEQIVPFIRQYMEKGVTQVISTDIDCDGMLQGPSLSLYKEILAELPGLRLIASGGVSGMGDIENLDKLGVPAVIVGKAIYEGRITMQQLEKFNLQK